MSSSWHFPKPLSTICNLSSWYFLSKSETTRNTRTADDIWLLTSFHFFVICSNGVEQLKNCVDQFFEQTNFEQLIMSPRNEFTLLTNVDENLKFYFHLKNNYFIYYFLMAIRSNKIIVHFLIESKSYFWIRKMFLFFRTLPYRGSPAQ